MKIFILSIFYGTFFIISPFYWGFYAHSLINRMAVYSLPPEMMVLYKPHIQFITEKAVNPDRRRYAVKGEAEKHYIDLDHYGDSALFILPIYWNEAVEKFGEDSLRANGIGPWAAYFTFLNLCRSGTLYRGSACTASHDKKLQWAINRARRHSWLLGESDS